MITALFGFLAAAWRLSGRISTSEASELWEEGRIIRQEYRDRLAQCELNVRQLRNEIQTVTARNTILRRRNYELTQEIKKLRG